MQFLARRRCWRYRKEWLIMLGILAIFQTQTAWAREPRIPGNYPPGITIGTPVGTQPPVGFYYFNEANFYVADFTAPSSSNAVGPPDIKLFSEAPKLIWSTPWKFLGARYMMWVSQPIVYIDRNGPSADAAATKTANANTVIMPLNLSWKLMPDLYFSTAFSMNIPDGQYNKFAPINIGYNFWTFTPELGLSYLAHQMNLTLHVLYTMNNKNNATDYYSGNHLYIDLTATKKWHCFEAGFVGYYDQQVTNDRNGGSFYPSNLIPSAPLQLAPGALLGYSFRKINIQLYGTYDIVAQDGGLKGYRIFSRVSVPINLQ